MAELVMITGASNGIGRAVARRLVRDGWDVAIGYRADADAALALAAELTDRGARAEPFALDLADPAAAVRTCLEVVDRLGVPACLVNNAGINDRHPADALDPARVSRVLTVDALGPILVSSAVAARMAAAGVRGAIVNVTSVHETIPISGGTAYCASKAALGMATRTMALDLARHGIRVNSVAPGETATRMNGVPDDVAADSLHRPDIPLGRPAAPSEVADAVAYLARAEYVTGVSLTVDGGLSLTAAEANAHRTAHRTANHTAAHRPVPEETRT